MKRVFMDLETYSAEPISHGSHRYAESPSSELLLWGYAIDEEPAKVWDRTSDPEMPADLKAAVDAVCAREATCVWHNGMNFDTVFLSKVMGIDIPLEQIEDTMVIAYQHSLPGSLADLCAVYRLDADHAKDLDGRRLVNQFCKPLPFNRKLDRATKDTHPEDWAKFVNYCRLDVEAERELYKRLPKWNRTEAEHKLQVLDATINRRGMLMDIELATAAIGYADSEKKRLDAETQRLTEGRVQSANQTAALLAEIERTYGIVLKSLQRAEVERLIADESLPEPMRELLRVRLSGAKAAVRKYQSVLDCVCADGRLRGGLQFRGASRTGRWAGRMFQAQNLSRPSDKDHRITDAKIHAIKAGLLETFFPDPLTALSDCLRGLIIVPEGKRMVVADYSNIEGRVLAWLADETWKLDAFRAFDKKRGHDLYKLTYAKAFNVEVESVTKDQRQMGKVLELALGYGGGPGAFATFARGYGIDLHDMAEQVAPSIPASIHADAVNAYEWAVKTPSRLSGLPRDVWLACDSVKRMWRRANPHIVNYWSRLGEACHTALSGVDVQLSHGMKVAKRGAWLTIALPSGRCLCYPAPREGDESCTFSYMGVNQFTRKWERIKTFDGKIVENLVQAVAADILGAALPRLERHRFRPILTIHDEVLTECADEDEFNHHRMEQIMCALPTWAEGLPLAAAGFEAYRYRKE